MASLFGEEPFDEARLIEQARRGHVDSFNALILRYQNQAYNLAYQLLQDGEAAADATQDAMLSAYRALGGFRGGSFRAWLLRIVANACYDEMRRRRRRPTVSWDDFGEMDEEANPHLADGGELPEAALQRQELRALLERSLAMLPSDQRMVLVLVDILGFAYEEAAETMHTQLGTIKSRLARARAKMRELLLKDGELLPAKYRQKEHPESEMEEMR